MRRAICLAIFTLAAGIGPCACPAALAAPVHGGARQSGCSAPLTLVLRPGPVPGATTRNGPPARDIPPGPVAVHLPLFAGAAPARALRLESGFVLPASYRKVAVAGFSVPATSTAAIAWYRMALSACGYNIYGQSYFSPAQYRDLDATFRQGLGALAVTFHPLSPGVTLVTYVVQVLDLPPRPKASFLHGPFVRVGVVFRSSGVVPAANYVDRFTITWAPTIARLVAAINSATQIFVPDLGAGGTVLVSTHAVLSFTRAGGGVRQVRVGGDLNTLVVGRTRPLDDPDGRVIRLVGRLAAHRCPERGHCT